jgi:glucose/mannose-6-phosphate isomerase
MAALAVLDNVDTIRSVDPGNMYNRIFDFPEQVAEAHKLADGWKINPADFSGVKNIVVIGMGGSAIGGDLVRSYLGQRLQVPMLICRHYTLPEFVDDETLVIASSYSGNTEETLAALDDALGRKAMLVAMTTGGLMADVCKVNDIPSLTLPTGMQPRAALGYSMVPLLILFDKLGLVKGLAKELPQAIKEMQMRREVYIEDTPTEKNLAKAVAAKLHGRIPLIYGGPTMTDVVAVRWKGQLCENSKNMSFANQFPEFNHNELVGYCDQIKAHKDHLTVVMIRTGDDHPKVTRRVDIVKGIIEKAGVPVVDVWGMGTTPLSRLLSLVQLGDFVSYYLAILNNVDPTPVAAIETLKKALAESN